MGKVPFTEEEETIIRTMWMAGHKATRIGREIGRSKNSVIGKAHRMNLPAHVSVEHEKVPFDELDTVRLPRSQRVALAELLSAHPHGVSVVEIGRLVFNDKEEFVVDPYQSARKVVSSLSRALRPYGWACGCLGDRKGVKLFPAREEAA